MKKALNFTLTDLFLIFVTFFVAFIYLMSRSQAPIKVSDLFGQDYSMPRPTDQSPNSFDLSDYQVNKTYTNPFAHKQVPANDGLTARGTPVKKADAPAKKTTAKKDKTKSTDKQATLSVDVVGEDRQTMSASDLEVGERSVVVSYQNHNPQTQNTPKKETEEVALTKDDWMRSFQNDGSQKEMAKLIKDLNAGKMTDVQFYEIVEELLKINSEEKQSLALYALSSVVKAKSFELMAIYQAQLPEKLAGQFQVALQAYSSLTRLSLLNILAVHTEEVVVLKAIEIIDYSARAWLQMSTDQLNQRKIASASISKYFEALLVTLQKQSQNQNAAIAQASQQALKQVESLIAKSKD